ncbi:hypothetical protein [Dyella sp. ASV21]|uniref:hypothetical protein n=1 Tax=Dyella sp. ASV21 TaxID=2795114 RepID=UPI0018EB31B1|nr:hypothetical protein [Dyella sp. ASV21]
MYKRQVFHHYDEPSGHGQMRFEQVRLLDGHAQVGHDIGVACLLYTSPSPRDP